MPVPTNLSDLSTNPAANSPASTDTISTTDDYLRAHAAILAKISDGTNALTTPSLGAATGTSVAVTTVDATNVEVTNIKAKDGTASATIADSTGVMTVASAVLTTADINGGTIDGAVIGGSSAAAITGTTITANTGFSGALNGTVGATTPAAGTFTTLTSTGNATLGDAEATDTHAIKGATTLLANSASAALTVTQAGAGNAFVVEDSTSPDSTPFVIDANGIAIQGRTSKQQLNHFTDAAPYQMFTSGALGPQYGAFSADGFGPCIFMAKSRNATIGANTIVQSGDILGIHQYFGADGTGYVRAAQISVEVDGTPGTNDMPGRLVFSTTADGASSPTTAVIIDSKQNVGIGATPATGYSFTVGKNITGAVSARAQINQSTIQSDVTTLASYYRSYANTADAAFTLPTLIHFEATQGALTGGSRTAPSNQYGFYVESSLTGATNNYGFYSNIASGTGRWNFFAAGSASNYFNGISEFYSGLSVGPDQDVYLYQETNGLTIRTGTSGLYKYTKINADGSFEPIAGQIKFPATQNASADANTLDDYEEGTFTPVVRDAAGGNAATAATAFGFYTKIGRLVEFEINISDINTTGLTAGNQVFISGLPFTVNASSFSVTPVRIASGNSTTGCVLADAGSWGATLNLINAITTGISIYTVSQIVSGSTDFRVTGHYYV